MKLFMLIFFGSALTVFGQEPRLFDEFPRIPCGDFMGRMDSLLAEWERDTSRQIFVLYYGYRYRKSVKYNNNGGSEVVVLNFAHRDDGLNWAKGVPRFLLARAEAIGA